MLIVIPFWCRMSGRRRQQGYVHLGWGRLPPSTHTQGVPSPTRAQGVPSPTHAQGVPPPTHAQGVPPPTHAQGVPPPTRAQGVPPPTRAQGVPPPQGEGVPQTAGGLGECLVQTALVVGSVDPRHGEDLILGVNPPVCGVERAYSNVQLPSVKAVSLSPAKLNLSMLENVQPGEGQHANILQTCVTVFK